MSLPPRVCLVGQWGQGAWSRGLAVGGAALSDRQRVVLITNLCVPLLCSEALSQRYRVTLARGLQGK